jgi:hypothetical protein
VFRRAAVLVALVLPFVVALASWVGCVGTENCIEPQYDEALVTALKVVVCVAGLGLVTLLAIRELMRRTGSVDTARPGAFAIGLCLAAGLLAATPISAGWSDGCNAHGGRVALVEAPRVWFGEPEQVHASYLDIQTLMLCLETGDS